MNDDTDRDRLLADVLAGDLDAGADEVVARCERDPEFAAALAGVLQMQRRVAAHGAMVREDLATPAPELERAAEAAMRASIAQGSTRRRRVWPWVAAAAAAVALATAVAVYSARDRDPGDQVLGGFKVDATDDGALQFGYVLRHGEHFVVTVVDADGNVVSEGKPSEESTWRPAAELAARWQTGWRVKVAVEASDVETMAGQSIEGWRPR